MYQRFCSSCLCHFVISIIDSSLYIYIYIYIYIHVASVMWLRKSGENSLWFVWCSVCGLCIFGEKWEELTLSTDFVVVKLDWPMTGSHRLSWDPLSDTFLGMWRKGELCKYLLPVSAPYNLMEMAHFGVSCIQTLWLQFYAISQWYIYIYSKGSSFTTRFAAVPHTSVALFPASCSSRTCTINFDTL